MLGQNRVAALSWLASIGDLINFAEYSLFLFHARQTPLRQHVHHRMYGYSGPPLCFHVSLLYTSSSKSLSIPLTAWSPAL